MKNESLRQKLIKQIERYSNEDSDVIVEDVLALVESMCNEEVIGEPVHGDADDEEWEPNYEDALRNQLIARQRQRLTKLIGKSDG